MSILPGATIGILGSGQLGRMLAIAAKQMGYQVHIFSDRAHSPAGQVSDLETVAAWEDEPAVQRFAKAVDVVTFEFENIPFQVAETIATHVPVYPDASVLATTQHRLREKNFLTRSGFPVVPFCPIHSLEDLETGIAQLGCPAVLKTAGQGYDGKGQVKIAAVDECRAAYDAIGRQEAVLESFVSFQLELSVLAARSQNGDFAHYGVFENIHANHILDVTVSPGRIPAEVAKQAVEMARSLLDALHVVGVLCIEFFLTTDGRLLINELAPRPHNSGHVTLNAAVTSQFEQQLRAVCDLPLGSTHFHSAAAMANLLGEVWSDGEPDWAAACAFPEVKLHLYGKAAPRRGRKMGHLTALAADAESALATVLRARESLYR